MLGRKERDELHARCFAEHVNRGAALAIAASVIRKQAESHAGQRLEVVSLEDVDSGQHFLGDSLVSKRKLLETLNDLHVVIRGLLTSALHSNCVRYCARDDRSNASAQWSNITFSVRMNAVAQEHNKHLARGIDPDRRACKTGVAERTERKQVA